MEELYASHNRQQSGLHRLVPRDGVIDTTTIDIVAIHGLDTESSRTWVFDQGGSQVNWLSDVNMLPAAIPQARIYTYDWNAKVFDHAPVQALLGHADNLLGLITAERTRESPGRPLLFVASCFGGLVATEAICRAAQEGSRYRDVLLATVGAIFLATPFMGSDAAKPASWLVTVKGIMGEQASGQLIRDLEQRRDFVQERVRTFAEIANADSIRLPIYCFFETQKTNISSKILPRGLANLTQRYTSHVLVMESSACIHGFSRQGLDAKHVMMNKFEGPTSKNYVLVKQAIQLLVADAPNIVLRRSHNTNHSERSPSSSTSNKFPADPFSTARDAYSTSLYHYGGLGSLRHILNNILKCLLEMKEAWAEGMPEHCFELEKLSHSLIVECEELDKNRSGTHTWRYSSKERDILMATWDLVHKAASRCQSEAANPLLGHLNRLLKYHSTLTQSSQRNLSASQFLELLAGYEDMLKKLDHHSELLCLLRSTICLGQQKNEIKSAKEVDSEEGSNSSRDRLRAAEFEAHKTSQLLRSQVDRLRRSFTPDDLEALEAVKLAEEMYCSWQSMSRNRHFPKRAPANSYYIGQKEKLEDIRKSFELSASPAPMQKRFVIQGQPGSGKTELALKYATESMAQFWGVFWIDASSEANVTKSFEEMAQVFGENPTEQAAKQFLANRHPIHPWLLIIDNADDDNISLERISPPGDKGFVLVTTRNPAKVGFGTAGEKGFLELADMEPEDASDLLLTAAEYIPKSRTSKVLDAAQHICQQLYHLPLALVHAGKAIHHHRLELSKYMDFFNEEAAKIRNQWQRKRSNSHGSTYGSWDTQVTDSKNNMSVFASFELLTLQHLKAASTDEEGFADALELLQTFSFMHFRNIRVDFLIQAAINPAREAMDRANSQVHEDNIVERLGLKTPTNWHQGVQQTIQATVNSLSFSAVLPEALKNPGKLDVDDLKGQVDSRVRTALRILASRSLITLSAIEVDKGSEESESDDWVDMYNMHPLVHKWVRERPRLSVAEQALYCQHALTILSSSIRLTGGDGDEELAMRRDLKPHIEHALACSASIQDRLQRNLKRGQDDWWLTRLARWATKLLSGPWHTQLQMGEHARFGKVFLECGAYTKAEELLSKVHDYLIRRLGPDNHVVHLAKLGLAVALLCQTRRKESTVLLREVYTSRCRTLGERHPRTLEITTQLAESVLAQGRITESYGLCVQAYDGLKLAYGEHHRSTIRCVSLIGTVYFFYFEFAESVKKHREAIQMTQQLAEKGVDVVPELNALIFEEQLAGALMQFAQESTDETQRGKDLAEAESLIQRVVQRREKILGRGHPYTLYGKAQFGRIMATRGYQDGDVQRLDKAEKLMKEIITAARRDLGDDHLGVLAGKKWYAEVLMMQGNFTDAEVYLREASDKDQYAKASDIDGEHPDRIFHVWMLVKCLEKKGDLKEALVLCRELEVSIPLVGGHGLGAKHKFNLDLSEKIKVLEKRLTEQRAQVFTV